MENLEFPILLIVIILLFIALCVWGAVSSLQRRISALQDAIITILEVIVTTSDLIKHYSKEIERTESSVSTKSKGESKPNSN